MIKGNERQFDVAARGINALEFTDMFATQASLDDDFVVCEMFAVDTVVNVFKRTVCSKKAYKAMRITNALRVRERGSVENHLSVG